jgi:hypothetical protein
LFESIIAALMGILNSSWFPVLVSFLVGSFSSQLPLVQRLWGYVMGVRQQLDNVEQVIDTVDAVLKANGVIPADAPKMSADAMRLQLKSPKK